MRNPAFLAFLPLAASLALAGCAVTSETPLFTAADAARHPLAQGVWALHGPGCEVTPGAHTPDCATTLAVRGDRIIADTSSMAGALGGLGGPGGAAGASGPNEFLLVEGDPQVLQLHALPAAAPPGLPAPAQAAAPTEAPGHRSYMAFKPTHHNAAGQSDDGILWLISCPKDVAGTPGFRMSGQGCEALTREAVRSQAPHVPAMFSYFMTWLEPEGGAVRP